MLVDREGSLWVATIRGLLQYPEPETTSLLDHYTLAARDIARTPQAVWVSSWSGLMIHRRTAGGWQSAMSQASYVDPVCLAADGAVWTLAPGHFFRHDPSGVGFRTVRVEGPNPPAYALACGEGRDGRVWFPTDDGVFVLEAGAHGRRGASRAAPTCRKPSGRSQAEDGEGNLWVGLGNRVCRAPTARVLAGDADPWSCETVPGMLHLTALRVTPSGDLWAATSAAGVWRRHAGRFMRIPASDALGSPGGARARALPLRRPLDRGGGQLRAGGGAARQPRGVGGAGARRGMAGAADLRPHGSHRGRGRDALARHRHEPGARASEARTARPRPPPVAVVEASVDGKPIPTAGEVALPYGKNRLELRFAALSYREPALIRYRTRLRPEDPWSEPTAQSSFRFVDLPAGRYRIEVQGSLDGRQWSPTEVAVAARVLPPWWKHAWFLGAVLALLLAVLALAYRVRVRQLLRLERQRTQIAMDLHDAIGSGLGSIRILSGLAVRETTPEATRATVSARIAEISDELATALGDIVWSLRPGTGSLEALGTQLVARATPLVTAQGLTLETSLPPAIPAVPLSLAVRRHVFLVGLEAVHNAARHAAGSRITLALERAGRRWRLRVEDDGRGLAQRDGSGRPGLGLESIRHRAAEIGAQALWEARPGGGTIFTLTFDGRADVSHDHATGAGGRPPASSGQP
jgi:signal transduction histidine kinase